MSEGRRNPKRGARRAPAKPARLTPADFWRPVPEPEVPGDITPAADPTALLRSLGPPPLTGQAVADRYLAEVAKRASGVATALAAVADLLAEDDD